MLTKLSPKICKAYKIFWKKGIDAQKTIGIEYWGGRENKLQEAKESLSIKLSESLLNLLHVENIVAESPTLFIA